MHGVQRSIITKLQYGKKRMRPTPTNVQKPLGFTLGLHGNVLTHTAIDVFMCNLSYRRRWYILKRTKYIYFLLTITIYVQRAQYNFTKRFTVSI